MIHDILFSPTLSKRFVLWNIIHFTRYYLHWSKKSSPVFRLITCFPKDFLQLVGNNFGSTAVLAWLYRQVLIVGFLILFMSSLLTSMSSVWEDSCILIRTFLMYCFNVHECFRLSAVLCTFALLSFPISLISSSQAGMKLWHSNKTWTWTT